MYSLQVPIVTVFFFMAWSFQSLNYAVVFYSFPFLYAFIRSSPWWSFSKSSNICDLTTHHGVINRCSHNFWKWCARLCYVLCALNHLFVLDFSSLWPSCFGLHHHDFLNVFLSSFFHRFNLWWQSCSSFYLCAFTILMFDSNIVHLFAFIVFTSPMCSTHFICLPTFVFSKLWCTMIVLFFFLFLCFHKSNLHQWFCSSSHLCAFKVLMCNGVFVHLLFMFSQF
jgi:hypothetical protein